MSEHDRRLGAVWAAEAQVNRRARQPLSRDQIVQGALDFLRIHRLEDLSMRRLAGELGIAPTSMYWHVATKEQLLDLVLDEIYGRVELPDPSADWRQDIRLVAVGLRGALRSMNDTAKLVVTRPPIGPRALRIFEFVLGTLRRAGFPDADIPSAFDLIANYTIGSVLVESSWLSVRKSDDPGEYAEMISLYVSAQPQRELPTLVELASVLFSKSKDEEFADGLELVLAGIAIHLA